MATAVYSARDVTPDWLTDVLRAHGSLPLGNVSQVTWSSPRELKHCVTVRLAARYADAVGQPPAHFFLKLARREETPETGRSGRKEVRFYQQLAPATTGLPALECYHADYVAQTGHWQLLLEDISESHWTPTCLPPGKSLCKKAVEILARLHAHWWENPALGDVARRPDDEVTLATFSRTESHLGSFMDFVGECLSADWRRTCERVVAEAPALFLRRVKEGKGLTLIHGDNHHLNHMYPHDAIHGKVFIVDWPAYNCWIGADDLAYMMALNWMPECRAAMERDLVNHYHESLVACGLKDYSRDDCWYDYRLAVIRMFCFPIRQWANEMAPWLWYNNLECATAAFRDLECEELL